MSADPDLALLATSLAFAGAAVAGSAAAIREQLPGITVPLSVPAGLLAGWGPALPRRGRCLRRRHRGGKVPAH